MKLKIVKGIASGDKQPSKKDEGFLSIEKLKSENGNSQ